MRLLVEAASDVPEIMTDPAPRAMFKGFGDSSLNFTLLAWVPTVDVGLQAQNALRVAILRKLDQAGIAIPSRARPHVGKCARRQRRRRSRHPRSCPNASRCRDRDSETHDAVLAACVLAGGSRRRRVRRTSNRAPIPMRPSASTF